MLVLTRSELERSLTLDACIDEMRRAMIATSRRECVLPLRQFMAIPGRPGKLGLMPGYLGGGPSGHRQEAATFGVKIVSKYERPPGDPHGSHVGAVMIFDADRGLPIALLEGGTLTAIRTSATTALASDTLARPDARTLAILGAGEEAYWHARALLRVRPFSTLVVWARSRERAHALLTRLELPGELTATVADSAQAALAVADVACTVTSAKEPFVRGEWLPEGLHLNLVGSAIPTTAEVDTDVVARSRFYVDFYDAARAQAGEFLNAVKEGKVRDDHIVAELGEVLAGTKPGRRDAREITVYKSLGITTQDLAAAQRAVREATARGLGRRIALDD